MSRTPINYESFIHPNDQRALAALKAIPLLDKVYKIIMEWGYEKFMYNMNLASLVKIGPNQMPKIYGMLQEVCDKLGIEEPELYLESGPANAYTFGETQRQIVLYSGAVAILSDDELKAVIAHECGHILCHHSLYGSMTRTLMQVGVNMIPLPNVMLLSLYYALLYWNRCSEYSADRVAAYVIGDADVVGKQLMKLTGGFVWNSGELNYNEFLRQADKVEDLEEQSLINKGINFWLALQTAMSGGFNNLQSQLASCCCENRLASADLKYTIATENCADRAAVSDGIRDILVANNANTQRILDQMCNDKIDSKNERIAELERELTMANLAASQTAQTSRILADNTAQTVALEQYLNPVPVPAYIVANPNCCNTGNTCGCGSF